MKFLTSYKDVPETLFGAVVAIGNFDGVHLGHQAVLSHARQIALDTQPAEAGSHKPAAAGVMYFHPHPRQFFSPDTPLFMLTNREQKRAQFEALGLDFALEQTFDAALSQMPAEEFVRDVLVEGLRVSHVVIGYDFFFGAKRGGNPEVMRQLGERFGFGVTVVSPTGEGGLIFSSTGVRDALEEGQVRRAAEILGRNWQVAGVVKSGAGRGEGLGFPTANIDLPPGCHLHHGIYAAFVHVGEARYKAAAYYGKRPSFDNDAPVLEVFLFDFEGNLYDREISVEFVDYVRGDMKFTNAEALSEQMDADCRAVLKILDAEALQAGGA